jgi:uncharacterized protein YbjT (DUF2867 family)
MLQIYAANPNQNQDANMTQNNNRNALLVGATGLVGRELLKLLLADRRYAQVHCVGRRAPAVTHAKLTAHVFDLAGPGLAAQFATLPAIDDVYCALGTTIKVAGSQAAFKAVDLDAVLAVAKAAVQANQAKRLGVVSAMGADAKSSVFYNRVKGEMEAAVAHLGFESVSIARPSMLAGDRDALMQASRPGEQIGLKLMSAVNFLIPANYKAINAAAVASALHRMVTEGREGVRIALSGELSVQSR